MQQRSRLRKTLGPRKKEYAWSHITLLSLYPKYETRHFACSSNASSGNIGGETGCDIFVSEIEYTGIRRLSPWTPMDPHHGSIIYYHVITTSKNGAYNCLSFRPSYCGPMWIRKRFAGLMKALHEGAFHRITKRQDKWFHALEATSSSAVLREETFEQSLDQ
jgi:hypothetical protein